MDSSLPRRLCQPLAENGAQEVQVGTQSPAFGEQTETESGANMD